MLTMMGSSPNPDNAGATLPMAHLDKLPLLLSGVLQGGADEPGALVVLNVCPNLANHGRVPIAVQVVVLDLQPRTGF